MTIFITLLICGVLNCLMLEAAQRSRSLWYSLFVAVPALALGAYALNSQWDERFHPLYPIISSLPVMTSIMLTAMVAINVISLVTVVVCLVKDWHLREIRPFFTYSYFIAFVFAIASATTYGMVTSTLE
jgi:sensor histidine kinase YesM